METVTSETYPVPCVTDMEAFEHMRFAETRISLQSMRRDAVAALNAAASGTVISWDLASTGRYKPLSPRRAREFRDRHLKHLFGDRKRRAQRWANINSKHGRQIAEYLSRRGDNVARTTQN